MTKIITVLLLFFLFSCQRDVHTCDLSFNNGQNIFENAILGQEEYMELKKQGVITRCN